MFPWVPLVTSFSITFRVSWRFRRQTYHVLVHYPVIAATVCCGAANFLFAHLGEQGPDTGAVVARAVSQALGGAGVVRACPVPPGKWQHSARRVSSLWTSGAGPQVPDGSRRERGWLEMTAEMTAVVVGDDGGDDGGGGWWPMGRLAPQGARRTGFYAIPHFFTRSAHSFLRSAHSLLRSAHTRASFMEGRGTLMGAGHPHGGGRGTSNWRSGRPNGRSG
eukprot:gene23742-biopygen14894